MRIIDISRDLFSTPEYPGDPAPRREVLRRMELGDSCNLSCFSACCHNATHMDAPLHFVEDGASIDALPPELFLGRCTVVKAEGLVTGEDIDSLCGNCEKMVLFQGDGRAFLTQSAAFALADAGFTLVGTDAQSIAPPGDETAPHRELLGAGIPVLEGLDLSQTEPGNYYLVALPLLLGGAEAAPVRAVLIEE